MLAGAAVFTVLTHACLIVMNFAIPPQIQQLNDIKISLPGTKVKTLSSTTTFIRVGGVHILEK